MISEKQIWQIVCVIFLGVGVVILPTYLKLLSVVAGIILTYPAITIPPMIVGAACGVYIYYKQFGLKELGVS